MKTKNHARTGQNTPGHSIQRPTGLRSGAAKAFENRYERRKIHERLRRLDWALNGEDEIFA
jgi:hypothetical protein